MGAQELRNLTADEEKLFQLIQEDRTKEVADLVDSGNARVNCLDKNGMSPLDQACFKGNEELVRLLIEKKANVDNRAHEQGYTCLMFAALAGKPQLCRMLLDAGARAHALNNLNKTASELAAFVGHYECASVISSYISFDDVDRIVHPQGAKSDVLYPEDFARFIHGLTRTHEVHPVRIVLDVAKQPHVVEHRKKLLWTVDRLFEGQLRSKEPNEPMSLKLWLILHVLRELLQFIDAKSDSDLDIPQRITSFARHLLYMTENDVVRPNEEKLLRTAVAAFPYKQSLLLQTLGKTIKGVPFGKLPSTYSLLCQSLFGQRLVMTSHFCATCGVPSAKKRCPTCKSSYCSQECQKLDWPIHKRCCEAIKCRPKQNDGCQSMTEEELRELVAKEEPKPRVAD